MNLSRFYEDRRVVAFVLLSAAFALYAVTFAATWTYDDITVIVNNPDVKSLQGFWANSYPGRPVRELSFLVDYWLFGMNPAGWHIQSILWHGLNAYLVFLLLRKLNFQSGIAFFSAALFLVHPVNVEVVANISHRKDSLALFFGLSSLLSYCSSFSLPRKKKVAVLALAVACYVVAIYAKQNMLLLPLLFVVYEVVYIDRSQRLLLRSRKLAVAASATAVPLVAFYIYQAGYFERFFNEFNGPLIKMNYYYPSIEGYYLVVCKSLSFMFMNIFYPVNLGVEYVFSIPEKWSDPWVLMAFVICAFFLVALVWAIWKKHEILLILVWVPLFYLPTSNLFPLSYFVADRYWYTPSVGLCVLVVWLVFKVLQKFDKAAYLLAALLVLVLAPLTVKQAMVWKDDNSLWKNALQVSPTSVPAMTNVGRTLLIEDKTEEALPYLIRASQYFNWPIAYYYLGVAYEDLGMTREAIRYFCFFVADEGPKLDISTEFVAGHVKEEYGVSCR